MLLAVKGWTRRFLIIVLGWLILAGTSGTATAESTVLFSDDLETGDFSKWDDGFNVRITTLFAHGGTTSGRTGGDSTSKNGKRWFDFPPQQELYLRFWFYMHTDVTFPIPGKGPHLIRLTDGSGGGGFTHELDFNIPAGSTSIQSWKPKGTTNGQNNVISTGFDVSANLGRWICFEVHMKLNDAGVSNGVHEVFIDGELNTSHTGLNLIGTSTSYFKELLGWSNVGGAGPTEDWPDGNWWYHDDMVLATSRVGCLPDVSDKTPPNPPSGLRISGQ